MTNNEPPNAPMNPFGKAFGSKARDPASIDWRLREAELQESERKADGADFQISWLPYLAAVAWLFGQPGWALAAWAVGILLLSPVYIWQIDQRRPRNDTMRAVALHAYGLLSWPLGAVVFAASGRMMVTFPVVFGVGVGFWIWAGLERRPAPPSADRAVLFAGAAIIYAATLPAAAAFVWWLDMPSDLALMVGLPALLFAILPILGVISLTRAARDAWRKRPSAAAP